MLLAVRLCTGSGNWISFINIVANNHSRTYITTGSGMQLLLQIDLWLMIVQRLCSNIAICLTLTFLICIYHVYFVAVFLIIKILLLLLTKILVWYFEILSITLVVIFVLACLRGMSLIDIVNVLFEL